jgi:hypothetical protein
MACSDILSPKLSSESKEIAELDLGIAEDTRIRSPSLKILGCEILNDFTPERHGNIKHMMWDIQRVRNRLRVS